MLAKIRTSLQLAFNTGKTKEPYTAGQIFIMFLIIIFLAPMAFNIFKFFALPVGLLIQFIFRPESIYYKIFFYIIWALTVFCGVAGTVYFCRLIWPKRKDKILKIEDAQPEDAEGILALQKISYRSEAEIHNDWNIQPLTQSLDEIKDEFQSHTVLKIMDNGSIIGSVRAHSENNTCYIGKLIVHPDYQNRGIGKKLMAEIESRFNDVNRYELFTGFKSRKNINFYEKLSYKLFREQKINDKLTLLFFEKMTDQAVP